MTALATSGLTAKIVTLRTGQTNSSRPWNRWSWPAAIR